MKNQNISRMESNYSRTVKSAGNVRKNVHETCSRFCGRMYASAQDNSQANECTRRQTEPGK